MPQIHVIIPVYNAKKFLRQAVDSVLNQPYKGIDIVLVNDGSTDGSAELCDEIAANEERVCVIHQANQGVSIARNAGIELVLKNGTDKDYIAFLDADDKWSEDFFDDAILSLFAKGYSLIGFQSCVSNGDLSRRVQTIPIKSGLHPGGAASVWLHSGQHFCAMFYSAQLLQQYEIRFAPGLKYTEDKIFRMQCLYLAENVWLENKLLHYYRMVQNSAMHRRKQGISYYVPIIDAYMKSDSMMIPYANAQRGKLDSGKVLAGIYVMDMLEEHYENFGSKKEADLLLTQRPEYVELLHTPFVQNEKKAYHRWISMKEHPFKFRLRCCLRGAIRKTIRFVYTIVYTIPFFAAIIDKKRYPVMVEK